MLAFLATTSVSLVVFLTCWAASRPGRAAIRAPAALIVAAHSDDCVIMGAELAWGVLEDGGEVRILYLTCSGPSPEAEISRIRAAEAAAAWARFGQRAQLSWLDLPQSPVEGPLAYGIAEADARIPRLAEAIAALPPGAVVLVPAEGESHPDHRTARRVALAALSASGRNDLTTWETPEYNNLRVMRQVPVEVLFDLIDGLLPRIGRFLPRHSASPGFSAGPPGSVFRDTSERLVQKQGMLDSFQSQDPALLRKFFSWASRYRPVGNHRPGGPGLPFVHGRTADSGVYVFSGLLALTIATLGAWLSPFDAGPAPVVLIALILVYGIIRRRPVLAMAVLSFAIGGLVQLLA